MSDLRTAARQALEALEGWKDDAPSQWTTRDEKTITALRAALEQPNECRWLQDGDEDSNIYMASCNRRYFELEDGAPTDNHMKYCCYCGKPLVEVPIEPEDNHD
jgi:hypothetical protein